MDWLPRRCVTDLIARLVHGGDVAFEVVPAVRDVSAVGTGEELAPERVAHQHGQLQVVPVDERRLQLRHLRGQLAVVHRLQASRKYDVEELDHFVNHTHDKCQGFQFGNQCGSSSASVKKI